MILQGLSYTGYVDIGYVVRPPAPSHPQACCSPHPLF
jgi:hypothetical protein